MVVPCTRRFTCLNRRNCATKKMENHILIKDARVIDLGGSFNGKKVSLRIQNGIITEIGKDLKPWKSVVWSEPNLCVSPGWMDGQVVLGINL